MRKRKTQLDSTPEIVDKVFAMSDVVTVRLKGDKNLSDEAAFILMAEETDEEPGRTMRIVGMCGMKVLCSELQDFIARMESRDVH